MANTKVEASFIRVKKADGSYVIQFPYTSSDEVITNVATKQSLTQRLAGLDATIQTNKDTVIDDMLSMVDSLSSFIEKPIKWNHIYVEDFSSTDSVNITSGIYSPGKITL